MRVLGTAPVRGAATGTQWMPSDPRSRQRPLLRRLYVDGALAGQMEGGNVYRDANGTVLPINGGGPLQTPATITLCSRFNDDPQRHYDGWVAHLGEPRLPSRRARCWQP